ncbi:MULTISPECIES: 3'(2'),5'-bisphosphate nucleotidase CysQ [unclassified Aureimonas]|uniref:3'(2'),5'-bisphosphate nucleotidase CysQ n=1 Tax=unclassified Aureimonas TaxID=2615206 RepID=UPI001FCD6987|nr:MULTISPECIES: 3'(2'),5'-bisphosphate nucleotidase CysQ [unclassified Aureimonas]
MGSTAPMETFTAADDLALLTAAAHEAGRIALGFFGAAPEVWMKTGNSPVSEADFAVDAYLKRVLLAARPTYGWLSEETETVLGAAGAERFFVVDPIDGTRSFLRGESTWCVSVAVIDAKRPHAGVIDAPAKGEVFTAVSGGEALLNGAPIRVAPAGGGILSVAVPDGMVKRFEPERAAGHLAFAKAAPSLAYRLAEIAAGRFDGTVIRPNANDWDIAAGDLILELAGGSLVDLSGAARLYDISGRKHGLLVAAAEHALSRLTSMAEASSPA